MKLLTRKFQKVGPGFKNTIWQSPSLLQARIDHPASLKHARAFCDAALTKENSGKSAVGYCLLSQSGVIAKHGQYIGYQTNNRAELIAMTAALDSLASLLSHPEACFVQVHTDCTVATGYATGIFKEVEKLVALGEKFRRMARKFGCVEVIHVRRTDKGISAADHQADKALCEELKVKKTRRGVKGGRSLKRHNPTNPFLFQKNTRKLRR